MDADNLYRDAMAKLADGNAWGAELTARKLFAGHPDHPRGWLVRAAAAARRGDRQAATQACGQAAARAGEDAAMLLDIATLQSRLGDRAAAAESYERLLTVDPENLPALVNLGNLRLGEGEAETAATLQRRAIAVRPDLAEAHYNLASALFHSGAIEAAFAEYEWRWRTPGFTTAPPDTDRPRWDGTADPETRLLVVPEQGLGDCIHFIRFAATARERVGHLTVETPAPLLGLFEGLPGIDELLPYGSKKPAFDCWAPMLSLPHMLGLSRDNYPPAPYLEQVPDVKRRHGQSLRLGFSWTGNPASRNNHLRTSTFEDFLPLLTLPDVTPVSLQKDVPAGTFDRPEIAGRVEDPMPAVRNFTDTARIVAGLDLVVTVDNVVAHLAGAMGKEVLVLLPSLPDWRWGLTSDRTFWYPSMKLFREDRNAGWKQAFEAVGGEIAARAAALSGSS
jgi:Tfp pilus assembly protein PilF